MDKVLRRSQSILGVKIISQVLQIHEIGYLSNRLLVFSTRSFRLKADSEPQAFVHRISLRIWLFKAFTHIYLTLPPVGSSQWGSYWLSVRSLAIDEPVIIRLFTASGLRLE